MTVRAGPRPARIQLPFHHRPADPRFNKYFTFCRLMKYYFIARGNICIYKLAFDALY